MPATILVIDDNQRILQVVKFFLERAGYSVLTATDGILGYHLAISQPVDLVILDIMMPQIDGFRVCERFKSDDKTGGIPVLFLSAKDQPQDQLRGFMAGCDGYLSKPFSNSELIEKVSEILKKKW
jgi:DNA-binding response OmpR family regulator